MDLNVKHNIIHLLGKKQGNLRDLVLGRVLRLDIKSETIKGKLINFPI